MNETRVVEIARQYLTKIRGAGPDNLVSLCPFHDDTAPSFSMNIHNGLFICYACGEQGNLRQFLTKMGLGPQELQFRYGKTLKDLRKNQPPPPDPTRPNIIMDANKRVPEDLLGLFNRCPMALLDEGFEEEVLQHFGVGVDTTHNRITYPLRDLEGNLVGISGRAMLDSQTEKYKVYHSEYAVWELPPYQTDKSLLLWNAHTLFKQTLHSFTEEPIVIVEGFKAAMWVHQAGVPRVVALMTKTMSKTQKWLFQRMGGPYIMMLDNDVWGIAGTIKVSRELKKSIRSVRLVEYDGNQPTDIPLEDIPGLIESATDFVEMALSSQ